MSFTFQLSLSVLNHLGRNLYRNFITVVGEAISNAWDADARNVWIEVDHGNSRFSIRDDGKGMDSDDFQNKFLRVGYSKRVEFGPSSDSGRPFIGRKGIGKLALLSCADTIEIASRVDGGEWVGGVIDNKGLDEAITDDLSPSGYELGGISDELAELLFDAPESGTSILFKGTRGQLAQNLSVFKRKIALYFRFSLLDPSFTIHINGEVIDIGQLRELESRTEFLWAVGELDDPLIERLTGEVKEVGPVEPWEGARGFIASVQKPRDLTIFGAGERVGIDLFVNGRLREKDILRHIPTARVAENYLYGQLHFNTLDGEGDDRFTSSREGVKAGDPAFQRIMSGLADALKNVINGWDEWRRKHREDGDPDNTSISKRSRKSSELFNEVTSDYKAPVSGGDSDRVDQWVSQLQPDAVFNISSYAECYLAENLVRLYISGNGIALSAQAARDVDAYKAKEARSKDAGDLAIEIRRDSADLNYLDMMPLALQVESRSEPGPRLPKEALVYKPLRDALMHTSRLSDEAKLRLTCVYDNIKARVRFLLFGVEL